MKSIIVYSCTKLNVSLIVLMFYLFLTDNVGPATKPDEHNTIPDMLFSMEVQNSPSVPKCTVLYGVSPLLYTEICLQITRPVNLSKPDI